MVGNVKVVVVGVLFVTPAVRLAVVCLRCLHGLFGPPRSALLDHLDHPLLLLEEVLLRQVQDHIVKLGLHGAG